MQAQLRQILWNLVHQCIRRRCRTAWPTARFPRVNGRPRARFSRGLFVGGRRGQEEEEAKGALGGNRGRRRRRLGFRQTKIERIFDPFFTTKQGWIWPRLGDGTSNRRGPRRGRAHGEHRGCAVRRRGCDCLKRAQRRHLEWESSAYSSSTTNAACKSSSRSFFSSEGYEVVTAGDLDSCGRSTSRSDDLDVVITDIQMPGRLRPGSCCMPVTRNRSRRQ